MKKDFFDLQLFADDAASDTTTAEATAEQGNAHDDNEPATVAEPKKKGEAKYTDDDVNEIIKRKLAEHDKKKQKEVDEAKKLAEMNAQQKAEYERDKLQKELDEYKRRDSIAEMTKTARAMLADGGISVSDDVIAMLVTTDAEKTKKAVDGFAKAFTEAVENAVKERLKGEPPKRGSGGGVAAMTKEQIMAIKDPELRQKKMLENKHLFNF